MPDTPRDIAGDLAAIRALLVEHRAHGHDDIRGRVAQALELLDDLLGAEQPMASTPAHLVPGETAAP